MGGWLRKFAMPVAEAMTADTQFGSGLHQGSTETTYLTQTAAVHAAEAHGMTAAAFYIDIASAFY